MKSDQLENQNPNVYTKTDERQITAAEEDDDIVDELDTREIFDLIRDINDPEHPLTLEQLHVVQEDLIFVDNGNNEILVNFTPTIPHCSMATLIGLSIRVKLLRCLPARFKVKVEITKGTHNAENSVNKQLADKERVAAALENDNLIKDELDLEELESRLYSQVYHGLPEVSDQMEAKPLETNTLSKPTNEVKKSVCRYFGPWSPTSRFQGKTARNTTRQDLRKNDKFEKPLDVIVLTPTPPKKNKRIPWRERFREKRRQKQALKKLIRESKNEEPKGVSEVITLSDTDAEDDGCVLIENKPPVILLAESDEEIKANCSDEVIFVEPEKKTIEVINLDDDLPAKSSSDLNLTPPRLDIIHQERKELLYTPDSNSNDFMSNSSIELNKHKFNFSLHGDDFQNCEALKSVRSEQCETESSSADGNSSINLMKNIVFNEIDFPKDDIFSESNLESFGKFITPLRNTPDENRSSPNDPTSDSESEEEPQINCNLPELSSVVSEKNIIQPLVQKKTKRANICSKYDLLQGNVTEVLTDKKVKKKRKNKKKRTSDSESNAQSTDVKVKKRRSDGSDNKRKTVSNEEIIAEPLEVLVKSEETVGTLPEDPKTVISERSSDSESVLSELQEEQDIQLNCSKPTEYPDFSVSNLQRTMSSDPTLWEIIENDLYPSFQGKGRRCNKCRQLGHVAFRCPNRKEPKCSLCGKRGHYEPRCPNKICTQCGQRSPYATNYCQYCFKFRSFRCTTCNMPGHPPEACPDLWRRYCLTVSEGPPVPGSFEGQKTFWCSGCAKSGHLEHQCQLYKPIYPPADPFIKSYEDAYQRLEIPSMNNYEGTPPVYNYNQNNMYQQANNQFISPVVDGIFINNQQNFFAPMGPHVVQIPQHGQIVYPSFISFDDRKYEQPNEKMTNQSKMKDFRCEKGKMFFSFSERELQHFINVELYRLSKVSLTSERLLKEMKKRPVPRVGCIENLEFYETLNMLFFGVLHYDKGRMHLHHLRNFKNRRFDKRMTRLMRRRLYISYCYIFGYKKHRHVDYNELLRNA